MDKATHSSTQASPWADGLGRLAVRCTQTLLVLALGALLVVVMVRLRLVVVPVLIAILLAAAISPLVRLLQRVGLPPALAVWVSMLSGFLAIGAVVGIVVTGVRSQWEDLRTEAEEGLGELQRYLASGPVPIDEGQLDQARSAVVEALQGEQFRTGAIQGATVAVEAVAGVFLGAVILFFLLKDGERIWEFLLRPLSGNRLGRMRLVGERSVDVLGGYVRGTAIIALVDSVIIGIALVVLGVPLALPLALVVFVGAFIALIVLGVVIAVNQIEGDVLAPVVLGRALSLHPLAILLALTVGTLLAGIIGALLSVPLAAVAWTAVTTWNEDRADTAPALRPDEPAG
ncbi:AI-2E family transporter [soil metagenome]